jgi:hypothetical protein
MNWPEPQVACVVHVKKRWRAALWYVSAGQAEQVRAAVLVSADICWPAPQ